MEDILNLIKELEGVGSILSDLPLCVDTRLIPSRGYGNEADGGSRDTRPSPASALILGFPACRVVRNEFICI
jgi:hypothetical protein